MRAIIFYWSRALYILYLILCLRFVGSTIVGHDGSRAVPIILFGVSAIVGFYFREVSILAFLAIVPLLGGLYDLSVFPDIYILGYLFSAISLGLLFRRLAERPYPQKGKVKRAALAILLSDIFITILALSMFRQLATNWSPENASRFLKQPLFGYQDDLYFITAAFVWFQGWFLFRETALAQISSLRFARSIFIWFAVTMICFACLQLLCHLPIPLNGYAFYSPFEDISSFGSIAVTTLVVIIAGFTNGTKSKLLAQWVLIAPMLALIVISWSRATWLSATLFLCIIAVWRLPRRFKVGAVAALVIGVALVNTLPRDKRLLESPYIGRLYSLGHIEQPFNKSPERVRLFHKAFGVISAHPLLGMGLGSFYKGSIQFAEADDPNGAKPDFAHDVFLQLAAELGLAEAAGFGVLILLIVVFAAWDLSRASATEDTKRLLMGVLLALCAYLTTQLTANSLNVYVSNQFVFWFLVASLVSRCDEIDNCGPSG